MPNPMEPFSLTKNHYNYVNLYRNNSRFRPKVSVYRSHVRVPFEKKKKVDNFYYQQLKNFALFVINYVIINWMKILRFFVATASAGYCFYQIITLLIMYLEYKTKVSISVSEPETIHMPGITVCTNTR
jgi:hypothetical protein